ncbi:MAG: hypothetical protein KDK78_10995 [Chlamydiia bacterium]|nr:hypothetical protein [Chlamydiia bacterium]
MIVLLENCYSDYLAPAVSWVSGTVDSTISKIWMAHEEPVVERRPFTFELSWVLNEREFEAEKQDLIQFQEGIQSAKDSIDLSCNIAAARAEEFVRVAQSFLESEGLSADQVCERAAELHALSNFHNRDYWSSFWGALAKPGMPSVPTIPVPRALVAEIGRKAFEIAAEDPNVQPMQILYLMRCNQSKLQWPNVDDAQETFRQSLIDNAVDKLLEANNRELATIAETHPDFHKRFRTFVEACYTLKWASSYETSNRDFGLYQAEEFKLYTYHVCDKVLALIDEPEKRQSLSELLEAIRMNIWRLQKNYYPSANKTQSLASRLWSWL